MTQNDGYCCSVSLAVVSQNEIRIYWSLSGEIHLLQQFRVVTRGKHRLSDWRGKNRIWKSAFTCQETVSDLWVVWSGGVKHQSGVLLADPLSTEGYKVEPLWLLIFYVLGIPHGCSIRYRSVEVWGYTYGLSSFSFPWVRTDELNMSNACK